MHSDLKNKSLRAIKWTLIEAIGLRTVYFIIGIILARLLLPEQFGLIGMLMIFMALAQTFLDSGFGSALIQKQDITQKDISSIFYFNILVSGLCTGILYVTAPWVAAFYNQPILTDLLRVLSVALVINAFGLVQNILLRKALDFKTETKISLIASLLSGIIGVILALLNYGAWSLVVQQLSATVFRTLLLWFFSTWRPIISLSIKSLKSMLGFSSKMLCANLLNTIFDNIYYIVIGKLFSPLELGFYSRADNLQKLPSTTLSSVILRVTFPVFCIIQKDTDRIKRGMKMALTMLALINFPLMIGLAIIARPLVLILLTDKWLPSVPYLQFLCVIGLMYPLQLINANVLQALGRPDLYLWVEVLKKIMIVINIMLTWRWGIMAMIAGQVVISVMSYCVNACFNKHLLDYSVWEQIKDLYPYLANAILMGFIVYIVAYITIFHPAILLISQIIIGVITYFICCWIFRFPAYIDLQQRFTSLFRL